MLEAFRDVSQELLCYFEASHVPFLLRSKLLEKCFYEPSLLRYRMKPWATLASENRFLVDQPEEFLDAVDFNEQPHQ